MDYVKISIQSGVASSIQVSGVAIRFPSRSGYCPVLGGGTKSINRQLRHALISVFLNQHADNLHQRGEWMRFVVADFVDNRVEQLEKLLAFLFGMWPDD